MLDPLFIEQVRSSGTTQNLGRSFIYLNQITQIYDHRNACTCYVSIYFRPGVVLMFLWMTCSLNEWHSSRNPMRVTIRILGIPTRLPNVTGRVIIPTKNLQFLLPTPPIQIAQTNVNKLKKNKLSIHQNQQNTKTKQSPWKSLAIIFL